MKTNVIMDSVDRELCGVNIRQRTKDEYFCLADLRLVVNKEFVKNHQNPVNISQFLSTEPLINFIKALEKSENVKAYYPGNRGTPGWVHPYLALKILTYHFPELEVKVYKWLWDYLMKYRKDSGDSYIKMSGVLYNNAKNKRAFPKEISVVASKIKQAVGCSNWNEATQEQLDDRDYLQNMIADLSYTMKSNELGVKWGLQAYEDKKSRSLL